MSLFNLWNECTLLCQHRELETTPFPLDRYYPWQIVRTESMQPAIKMYKEIAFQYNWVSCNYRVYWRCVSSKNSHRKHSSCTSFTVSPQPAWSILLLPASSSISLHWIAHLELLSGVSALSCCISTLVSLTAGAKMCHTLSCHLKTIFSDVIANYKQNLQIVNKNFLTTADLPEERKKNLETSSSKSALQPSRAEQVFEVLISHAGFTCWYYRPCPASPLLPHNHSINQLWTLTNIITTVLLSLPLYFISEHMFS